MIFSINRTLDNLPVNSLSFGTISLLNEAGKRGCCEFYSGYCLL